LRGLNEILIVNRLYKITATELDHFGVGLVVDDYFTSDGTEICDSNNKVRQVTDPPSAAVHIISSLNGTVRNWASIESGFNPNNIASWVIKE